MQVQSSQKLWIIILSVSAIVFAFYLFNPFNYYFLNDDLIHIPLSKDGVLFQRNSMRPLGDLSVSLDYFLWGKEASGYHFTNLFLHLINTVLLFILSNVLKKKYTEQVSSKFQSFMVAVLFFVYAFHSETIFWILGRSASLATLFFIPAMIFYLKRNEKNYYFFLSLICFVLSLLAYESVWIFPIVGSIISLVDHRKFQTSIKKESFYIVGIVMVFVSSLVLRHNIIGEVAGSYEASAFIEFDIKKLLANIVRLIGRCFIPPTGSSSLFLLLSCCLIFLLAGISALSIKRNANQKFYLPLIVFGLIISFLPYLSLGIDTHGVEGERYLYMPSVFACLLLVHLLFKIKNGSLQLTAGILLLGYNIFFLAKSASYFSLASEIAETTITEIHLLKNKKRLFIDSLPQSYNGALIFRSGFEEGIQWLKREGNVDSIFILSTKQDNKNWSKNYHSRNPEIFVTPAFNKILIRDTTFKQTYISKSVLPITFNQQTDAWFRFHDDNLEIIK